MKEKRKDPADIYAARAAQPDFCPLAEISGKFIVLLILLEDRTFFRHRGIDPAELRAAVGYTLRGRVYGGSTITQQLVKNLYFSFERSLRRKIRELRLALWLERKLTKRQILELYINVICFGNGQYGLRNASRFYFDAEPGELTLNQAFLLVCVLPVIGACDPLAHPEKFAAFRDRRLASLAGYLTPELTEEIRRHGPERLDEKLRAGTEEAKTRYGRSGPMINERFGPGGSDCLTD